jgi:hypothetical protein
MDSFRMFAPFMSNMYFHFKLYQYADCVEVTNPTNKEYLYVLMSGEVTLISSESAYKQVRKAIWKKRKIKKKKDEEIRLKKASG